MGIDAQGEFSVKLGDQTLNRLPEGILRPGYDRSALTPGIVHIGLGNFHRAHQAWYLHRLMQQGDAHDWAILGAGVRPYDTEMRTRLLAQDCLTTLIELDPSGVSAEVCGSMVGYIPIEVGNPTLISQMADPAIRIVSLTVTEGGYYQTSSGDFDVDHPDIRHDAENPHEPRTAFGAIVAALSLRRREGRQPFTALSCDNLQGNGDILRGCITGLARLSDAGLADWIDASVTFPNSMVDCIVPATSPDLILRLRHLGVDDSAPVSHESFRQWVIEDKFCAGRPAWEKVGVTLTDNVHVYETMKLRILNGGHQLLANAGEILSVPTIAACMADPQIAAFFRKVQSAEIVPHVKPVPGMAPQAYLDLIAQRFSNPEIHDSTRRVAFDGSSRHPGFLLPSVVDALRAGQDISGLALAEALWARMCVGQRENGSAIEPNDPNWGKLTVAALAARDTPAVWLAQDSVYSTLGTDARFTAAFAHWLNRLWADGTRATLAAFIADQAKSL